MLEALDEREVALDVSDSCLDLPLRGDLVAGASRSRLDGSGVEGAIGVGRV